MGGERERRGDGSRRGNLPAKKSNILYGGPPPKNSSILYGGPPGVGFLLIVVLREPFLGTE